MTDAEVFQFLDVFKGVARVFPQRGDEHELKQKSGAYFKAMRRFQLNQVAAGADVWMERGKYFPKPSEWIDSIPRQSAHRPEVGELTAAEIVEYEDAERRHYDGEPCRCQACRAAGVDHRLLRFVPEVDANGQDAKGKIGDRIVVRGHWAHGQELAGYYRAKAAFWAMFHETVTQRSMPRVTLQPVTAGDDRS